MMPLPTVFATAVVTKAPARFATAAMNTAHRGESARVETEVATAFAVSWNPFVKSKPSATTTVTTSRTLFTGPGGEGRTARGREASAPSGPPAPTAGLAGEPEAPDQLRDRLRV